MDKWETLNQHIDRALEEIAEELKGKVKEARDDALVDELNKINTTLTAYGQRLSAIEDRLPSEDDD